MGLGTLRPARLRSASPRRRGGTSIPAGPSACAEAVEARRLLSSFLVTTLADDGPGSLREAVGGANATPGPDSIDFAQSVRGTISLSSGQLLVTDSLTVNGPGADALVVSGGDASRVLSIAGGVDAASGIRVVVAGLTLTRGRASSGGAVFNAGFSDLALRRVVVSDSRAVGTATGAALGGGVRSSGAGAALTLSESVVTGNHADGAVNARAGLGGGILVDRGTLRVLDSFITANEALGDRQFASGGGISLPLGGQFTLEHTAVLGNRAVAGANRSADGGGIGLTGVTTSIVGGLIAGNTAVGGTRTTGGGNGEGGGLSVLDGSATVADTALFSNRALGGPGGGGADGGGIFAAGSFPGSTTLVLTRSSLSGNQAVGGDGVNGTGAGNGGAVELGFAAGSITDCTLSDNRAVAGNGSFHAGDDNSVNTAFGGAVVNVASQLEINHSTLRGNQALGGSGATHDAPNAADVGGAHGGAVFNTFGASAVVRDSAIEDNRAVAGNRNVGTAPAGFVGVATGGAIDNSFDGLFVGLGPTTLTVINSTLRHNEAVGGDDNTGGGPRVYVGAGLGGALANYFGASSDITGSSLDHNRAGGGGGNAADGAIPANLGAGGALFNAYGNFQLDTGENLGPSAARVARSTLDHNDAEGGRGSAASPAGAGYGGGAYNDATSSLALDAACVTHNRAAGGTGFGRSGGPGQGIGGGVYNLGLFTHDALTVIDKNHATTGYDDIFG